MASVGWLRIGAGWGRGSVFYIHNRVIAWFDHWTNTYRGPLQFPARLGIGCRLERNLIAGRAMPQIFHPSMNTISRATIFGAVFIIAFIVWLMGAVVRSPYATSAGVIKEQPVPFSHEHHVAECGIDCRYCHTSVEQSPFAGIPPTETCMNCHSFVWSQSAMLEPVRESFRDGKPLVWNRVNDLPNYVYFDHSIHVNKGVACTTCHGDVGNMPLMYREASLLM